MAEAYPTTTSNDAQQKQESPSSFQPIEPQFNSSQPSPYAQQYQDFTAPQQPYFTDPSSGPPPKVGGDGGEVPSYPGPANSGYTGFTTLQRNITFLKRIPGILNIIVVVSILIFSWFCLAIAKLKNVITNNFFFNGLKFFKQ